MTLGHLDTFEERQALAKQLLLQAEVIKFHKNTKQFKDVQNFFDTMPRLKHTVSIKNPKTKKTSEVTLAGLNDFFS